MVLLAQGSIWKGQNRNAISDMSREKLRLVASLRPVRYKTPLNDSVSERLVNIINLACQMHTFPKYFLFFLTKSAYPQDKTNNWDSYYNDLKNPFFYLSLTRCKELGVIVLRASQRFKTVLEFYLHTPGGCTVDYFQLKVQSLKNVLWFRTLCDGVCGWRCMGLLVVSSFISILHSNT